MAAKENGENLPSESDASLQQLRDRIEEMDRALTDDEDYCDRDIDSTLRYVETMEKKFLEKFQEFKKKLQQIREDNRTRSAANRAQFDAELEKIDDLFSSGKHLEATKKFEEYATKFTQRSTLIDRIPKLHMTESDIEQLFSPNPKSNKPSVQSTMIATPTVTILTTVDQKVDVKDETNMTDKDRLRQNKKIEKVDVEKDDRISEEKSEERDEPVVDNALFGIRSKGVNNQQTTITGATNNIVMMPPPPPLANVRPRFSFSTRLNPTINGTSQPSSPRLSNSTNSAIRNNYGQARGTSTPPNAICSTVDQSTVPRRIIKLGSLKLNPVYDYKHDQNFLSLMACSAQYIVLFKSRLTRLDKWQFGVIERRSHISNHIDWHDGLLTSLGYYEKNMIYMFTEREFCLYSLIHRQKLDSRLLPRGNDDESSVAHHALIGSERGIGIVYDRHVYHIYLNRKSRWTLSKTTVERLTHVHDYDLTGIFPDVDRFIHLCINEKTMNFLVQMNDSSYAVVFCLSKDPTNRESIQTLLLPTEKQPLTIYSAFIESLKEHIFFVNNPAIGILHIFSARQYIDSYQIDAHAICYVADQHELMLVKNNAICSINLNDPNLFFYIPANSLSDA